MLFVRLFDLCLFEFVGFLFLLMSGKGCDLWLWHSLDFSLTFFGVNINGFSPNPVCELILWRSGLGLLMGEFYQWLFTKLGVFIDIVEICFGIADRQILSIFDRVICPGHVHILIPGRYLTKYLCKLGVCIDIVNITSALGSLMVEFHLFLTEWSARNTSVFFFFFFRTITCANLNGFSPNFMCTFIQL